MGTRARTMVKVGINGFGRIGRLAFRLAYDHPELEFVHINEFPGAGESSAYLAKYDSIHGQWAHGCSFVDGAVEVNDGEKVRRISYSTESTPGAVDWDKHGVELVLECSGQFLTRDALAPYFAKGVKRVLVSAPVKDKDDPVLNIVYGVNHGDYDAGKDKIVTAASCTTNCLAPVVSVVQTALGGIKRGSITTIHNVTNTQTIVDAPNSKKSDLRRARSGMTNLAPTSTGSATAIALIFPELKGKLNGLAVRVPLLNGSLTDCVLDLPRDVTVEEVNGYLKEASENELKNILGYETQPLVSTDYINDKRSSIIDALSTKVVDKRHLKIYAWYDNEYGYSARMADIANMVVAKGL